MEGAQDAQDAREPREPLEPREARSRSPRREEAPPPLARQLSSLRLGEESLPGGEDAAPAPAGELSELARALARESPRPSPRGDATGRSYLELLDVEKHFLVMARKTALQPVPRFYVNFQDGGDGGLAPAVVRFNDPADAAKSRIRWGLKVGLEPTKTPFLLGAATEATSEESWTMAVVLTPKQEAFVRAVDRLVMQRMEATGVVPGGFMSALKSDASGASLLTVKAVLACAPGKDTRADWKILHNDSAGGRRVVHTQRSWPPLKRELEQYNGFAGSAAKLWIYPSPWTHGRGRCGNGWKLSAAIVSIAEGGASGTSVCLSDMPAAEEDF